MPPSKNAPDKTLARKTDESLEEDAHSGIGLRYYALQSARLPLCALGEEAPQKVFRARICVLSVRHSRPELPLELKGIA